MSADERRDAVADQWRRALVHLALAPETPTNAFLLARFLILPPKELLADPDRCDRIVESAFNEVGARRGEPPSAAHKGLYTRVKARVAEVKKLAPFAFDDGLFERPPPEESTG